MLKVALDATPLRGARTGIGEFCFRALEALASKGDLDMGAFAVSRHGRRAIAGLVPQGVDVLGPPGPGLPARLLHRSWARWAFPPAGLYTGRVDVVHGTNFVVPPTRRAAMVVSVHDLSPWHFPQWCRPAARGYPGLVRKAVERGAWVHTDSQFVAQELMDAVGIPGERVRTVYLGTSPAPAAIMAARTGEGAPDLPDWVDRYVLALGTVEPRKDLPALVGAFGHFAAARPGLALVIAGADGLGTAALQEAVAACPARERILRLGWVSEGARDRLIAGAAVYAYPSRYEGFGLSPLQAMAAGTPVVATRAGALTEVLGEAAWLVEVGDEDALAQGLETLVDDQQARQAFSAKGVERASRFSWDACAAGLASLYHEAAEARLA
jgi:glycosyltransferase involved in cell wall biosynthesis